MAKSNLQLKTMPPRRGLVKGQYASQSSDLQSSTLVLDILNRQNVLTQKISKEACAIWSGTVTDAAVLDEDMDLFEATTGALIYGMPELGVPAAPTPEILEMLNSVAKTWNALKPNLVATTNGDTSDPSVRSDVLFQLEALLERTTAAAKLY